MRTFPLFLDCHVSQVSARQPLQNRDKIDTIFDRMLIMRNQKLVHFGVVGNHH
jgi:hypothetical protein